MQIGGFMRGGWLAAATVLAMTVQASGVRADEGNIKVTVVAILASDKHSNIDKELKDLARELRKKEPTLTGFVVERSAVKSLKVGDKANFELVEKQAMDVLLRIKDDSRNQVSLTVSPPTMGDVSYTTCCGKYFPFFTSYRTKSGEKLIIAVMVKPCTKK